MQYEVGKKYLITTDAWFMCPDGEERKAIFGTLKGIYNDTESLGIKTNARSANWYVEIGNMKVAGCQIHYSVQTDSVSFENSRRVGTDGQLQTEHCSRIYNADEYAATEENTYCFNVDRYMHLIPFGSFIQKKPKNKEDDYLFGSGAMNYPKGSTNTKDFEENNKEIAVLSDSFKKCRVEFNLFTFVDQLRLMKETHFPQKMFGESFEENEIKVIIKEDDYENLVVSIAPTDKKAKKMRENN